jgi:VCBS repeat protein/FG-GAP repeat protein
MGVAYVNDDGIADIAVALNSSRVSLLLGNGNGTFQSPQQFVAGLGSNSVALVDVNGDGKIDIITANRLANVFSVLLGNSACNFQPQQRFVTGNQPSFMTLVDLNGDGKPDVATANRSGNNVSVILHRWAPSAGPFPHEPLSIPRDSSGVCPVSQQRFFNPLSSFDPDTSHKGFCKSELRSTSQIFSLRIRQTVVHLACSAKME